MKTLLKATVFSVLVLSGMTQAYSQSIIYGTVTNPNGDPIEGLDVYFYKWTGSSWAFLEYVSTDGTGLYNSYELVPGDYRIEFSAYNSVAFTGEFVREFYNDTKQFGNAEIFTVIENPVDPPPNPEDPPPDPIITYIPNIDAVLDYTQIKGTVIGRPDVDHPDGAHVRDITVEAFKLVNNAWIQVAIGETDEYGKYLLGGIAMEQSQPTHVRLKFSDAAGVYLSEVYNNVATLDEGMDVVADFPVDTIDVSLAENTPPPSVPPQILGVESLGGSQFRIFFTGQPLTQNYQLEKSLNLSAGWLDEGLPFTITAGVNNIDVIQEGAKTFWRVKEVPAPPAF